MANDVLLGWQKRSIQEPFLVRRDTFTGTRMFDTPQWRPSVCWLSLRYPLPEKKKAGGLEVFDESTKFNNLKPIAALLVRRAGHCCKHELFDELVEYLKAESGTGSCWKEVRCKKS